MGASPKSRANAAFRSTVNLTVLSVRASRDVAVRLTALPSSQQLADVSEIVLPAKKRLRPVGAWRFVTVPFVRAVA